MAVVWAGTWASMNASGLKRIDGGGGDARMGGETVQNNWVWGLYGAGGVAGTGDFGGWSGVGGGVGIGGGGIDEYMGVQTDQNIWVQPSHDGGGRGDGGVEAEISAWHWEPVKTIGSVVCTAGMVWVATIAGEAGTAMSAWRWIWIDNDRIKECMGVDIDR